MNTNIKIIAGVIILVFGSVFYWYSYRPSEIKKSCYKNAVSSAQMEFKNEGTGSFYRNEQGVLEERKRTKSEERVHSERVSDGIYHTKDFDSYYASCLKREGL